MAPKFAAKFTRFAPVGATLLYLEGGQSNSAGADHLEADNLGRPLASNQWLSGYTFSSRTKVYWKRNGTVADMEGSADNGNWDTAYVLQTPLGKNTSTNNTSNLIGTSQRRSNATMYTLKSLEQGYPNNIRCIKVARGSTGFFAGTGPWASNGSLDIALRQYHIPFALNKLVAEGITNIRVLPFYWNQGEADQSAPFSLAYQAQVTALFSRIRTALNLPNLPIIIAKLSSVFIQGDSNRQRVRNTQEALIAANIGIYGIETDDLVFSNDFTHYTEASYQLVSQRYLDLAKRIGTVSWGGF